jgi:hypothetical protein
MSNELEQRVKALADDLYAHRLGNLELGQQVESLEEILKSTVKMVGRHEVEYEARMRDLETCIALFDKANKVNSKDAPTWSRVVERGIPGLAIPEEEPPAEVEQTCDNCAHAICCENCGDDRSKWQPVESIKKSCRNCKYEHVGKLLPPCDGCFGGRGYTGWQRIESEG